ncbi:MAG TPA: hypothetical protein PK095_08600, partial [Myxococcota bacterium]|nr:hypothetical protein [Myxococcota bacterium]
MPTARVLTALSFVLLSGVGRAVPLPFTPTERGYTTTMGSCPALVDEGGLTLGSGRLLLEGAAPLALVPSSAVPIHYRVGSRAETVLAPTALSYAEPWPGIELMLAVTAGGHKRDLIVEPGADPSQIAFIAEGLDMGLEDDGSLHLSDGSCTYLEGAPVAWQVGPDGRVHVPIRWALSSPSRATFELGAYDPTRTLFIDPLIPAGGLFGPTLHEDAAYDVVIAPDGTTYVVGGAHPDPNVRGTLTRDAFVLALAPDRSLRWLTWYGGTRDNLLSPTCQAYATPNDPNTACITWGAHPSGLGGNDDAIAAAIVDDRLAVAGHTFSTDLPTLGAFIATAPLGPAPTTKGRRDGFLLILDRATGAPVMASYLGGDSDDLVSGIHATADGWVTVLGGSSSPAWGTPLPDPVPTPYLDFYAYAFTVSRSSDPERWVPTEIFGDAPLLAVQPPGRAIFNGALTQVEDTWLLGDHRGNAIRYKAFSKKTDYLAAIIHAFDLGTEQDGRARTAIVGNAVGEVGGFDGLACSVTEPTACAGRPCGMTDAFVAFLIGDSCDNVAYIGGGLGDVLFGAARARYAPDRDFLVLAGRTASSDLATRAAIQPRAGQPAGNGVDAFYAVVDVETQALRILSYLGGAPDTQTLDQLGSDDVATAVSLGPDRQATVVGMTRTLTRGDETLFVRRMGGHTGLHQTEAGQAFVARFPVEVADLAVTLNPETMVLAHEAIRSVTLTLSNSGTVEATHVSVLVDFQRVGLTLANTPGCTRYQAFPWTWMCVPPGGRLASGASHTFTLAVKAPATDGTYDIQTIARTATHDPNSDNDNAAATVKVGGVDFQPLIRPGEAMSSPVVVSPLDAAVVDVSALNYGPELARPRLTVSGSSDLRVTLGANASTCTATRCGVEDCLPVTCDLSAMNPSTALAAEYERQLSLRVENPPRTAEVTYVLTARTTALDGKTDLNPANDAATLPITFRYPDVVAVSAEPNPKVVAWGSDTTMLTLVGRDDGPGFDEGGLVVSMKFSPFAPNTVPETCDVDVATSVISCTLPRPPQGLPVGQLYSVQFGLTAPGRDEGEVAREVSLPVQWRGASVPEDSKPTNNLIQAKLWLGAVDVRVHPPEPLPTLLTHKVVETTWGVQNHSSEVARDVVVSQTFSGPPGTEIVLARVLGVDCPVASSATVTTVTCTIPEIAAGQRVNMLVDVKALGKGEIGHTLQVTTPVANASAAMFPSTRKFIAKGVDLALELQSDVTQLIRDETGTVAAIKVTNAGPGATPPEGATLVIDIPIAVKDVTSSTPALGCTATPTPLAYRSGARVTCKVFFDGSAGQVRETVLGFTPDAKGTLKLTARAQSPDEESPADNERERSFDVRGAELEVTVSGLPKVEVGTTFDVAVRVLNRGPAKIAHFVASMNLPVDRLELVGPPPTGCGHIDGEIDCEGQLDSGAEKTFTLQLRGKKTGAAIATVLAEQGDPGEAKLSGKLELEVLGPDLAVAHVTSRPSAWLTPPQTGEVDFRVVNKSTTTTADGVRVVMKIDKNTGSTPDCANPLAPVTSEVVQGGCVPGGVAGELTCTLAPGAEATLRFSVKASCAGEATLTVEANPSGAELDKTNNKASAAISVRVPKLGLKILGDPLTQALTIEGPYDALLIGAVEVKDLSGYGVGAGPNADDKIIIDLAPQRPFEFQAITTAGGICQVDPIGGSARCLLDSIGQNATVLIPFDLRSTHGPARGVLPVVASGPGIEVTSTQAPIIARGPDLAVTVLSAPGGKQVDERGEWVVRVFNAGSAAAEHPAITFTQPTGALDLITVDGTTGCNPTDDGRVCTITGPIGPAESVNVTFGARLKKAGDLSIPVRVTSRYEPDEDGTNNTASLTTRVLGPDLAPEIALLPDTAGVGDAVTIQLSVQNKGSVQSPPTAATLQIGPSLNVGVLPPGCAIQQGIALCSVPALAPTQTQVFSVQATTLRPGVFNLVSVVLSPGDSDPSNDKASATLTVTSVDSDGDGIDDSVEDKAPGGGDANGDGTPDRLQPQVTSILIAKHGYLVAEALSGTTLQLTPLTTPPTVPAGHKAPIAPGGLFTFKVSGLTPNARTTVRFTLPPGVPAQSWWKYDDTSAQWSEYTWDAATQTGTTTPSARVLEVTLQDNGRGDEDPTPGVVVDPGAALVKALTVDDARDLADLSPGDGLCATSEGTCTLRAAIEEVNAASSPRYLSFAFAAPTTLALASPLPAITTAVIIDGSD